MVVRELQSWTESLIPKDHTQSIDIYKMGSSWPLSHLFDMTISQILEQRVKGSENSDTEPLFTEISHKEQAKPVLDPHKGTSTPRLGHKDYTVGWICALPKEMAAARAMLDQEHNPLPARNKDNNIYVLGELGDHNVVIACLPSRSTGTVSAANVAQQMLSTFQSIRFGLMVGIGGGIPSIGVPNLKRIDII